VDAGLKWLDKHDRRNGTVRLLEIPSQLIEALWVVPDARRSPIALLILSAPEAFRLPTTRRITARALLTAIHNQTFTPT
jgi:hypothetical protein